MLKQYTYIVRPVSASVRLQSRKAASYQASREETRRDLLARRATEFNDHIKKQIRYASVWFDLAIDSAGGR